MPNDLLEQIKKLDYTHDQVLEILKKSKEAEGTEPEEPEDPEEPEEPEDPEGTEKDKKTDKTIDIDITKLAADITKQVSLTVSKVVSEEIKTQIKKLRGPAPKGERSEFSLQSEDFVKRNLFEKIV